MDLKQKYLLTSSFNCFGPNVSVSLKIPRHPQWFDIRHEFQNRTLYKYPLNIFISNAIKTV